MLALDQPLVELNLTDYFDFVQAQDDCEFKKPDGRFFDSLLKQYGGNSERIIYIGDELKDGQAARSAGLKFIGVESGLETSEEFADAGFNSVDSIAAIALRT